MQVRNAMGLLRVLQEFFPTILFKIHEFIPTRVELSELPELGSKTGGRALKLAGGCTLGRTVIDYMSRICVEVGPISFEEYLEFTPEGNKSDLLRELINLYVHDGLEYDIRCVLRTETMGTIPWSDRRLRLGVSLWMGKPKEETVEVYYPYERFVEKFH